jgi:AAA+ ATPase superfamily predicted ATPase
MRRERSFHNRAHELERLHRRWDQGEAQIFTLWGRRRVGKSQLLRRFARDKRHVYFEATSGTRSDQLADFSDRLAEATGRAPLSAKDWRTALNAVADWAEEGPVLLVLDEFQFIARENRDIGSIINVWWSERGEALPIFLVLCGSEVGFFEREVVNYSATTYGRRAGQLRLRPFRASEVRLFVPEWSPQDQIAAYAVFGNMPYYLAHIRPEQSLAENILDLILMDDGLLHEEARLLLELLLCPASDRRRSDTRFPDSRANRHQRWFLSRQPDARASAEDVARAEAASDHRDEPRAIQAELLSDHGPLPSLLVPLRPPGPGPSERPRWRRAPSA